MITKLVVSNYVLIDKLEVLFTNGFTTITGETGAGKSIILGALSLLLGDRADAAAKKHADKKVIAEGVFNINGYALSSFFESHDLDFEPNDTTLRREILPSGKSRAFINDTPVKLSVLRSLGMQLVDIHSQHENQQLLQPSYQLQFLDAFAGHKNMLLEYSNAYKEYTKLRKSLEFKKMAHAEALQKADYLQFQLAEFAEANIQNLDFETLKSEFALLENADDIRVGIQGGLDAVSDGDVNVLNALKAGVSSLEAIAGLDNQYADLLNRLQSVEIEVDDIRLELESLASNIEANPNKLSELKLEMDNINRLLFKHQVGDFSELKELQLTLKSESEAISNGDDDIELLSAQVANYEVMIKKLATELHVSRSQEQLKLCKEINSHLARLGMPNAAVEFDLQEGTQFTSSGNSELRVLFSANKGFKADALEKVASGGERSRLMLVLKKIHAQVAQTPTLILDEIDTGISGEVAAKTANMLAEMTTNSQIISITHLPQVAAKASTHFLVAKHVTGNTTVTSLKKLSDKQREQEVARMLSGENISEAALNNARQLMEG